MAEPALTLKEAAERLGVHYMTVYRYVRLGMLPARKSGSAWRVAAEDVAAVGTASTRAPSRRRPADWRRRLQARLVVGDEPGSWGVVEAALASGLDPVDIYEDLLAPALNDIGEQWSRGEVDVADEHRASAVAARIIGRLGPRFARRGRSRGTVVTATPAADLHGLGLAVVGDLLRGSRFDVVDLGSNVPEQALHKSVREADRLVAVAISSHDPAGELNLAAAIASARRAAAVPVVIGGSAVRDEDHARLLGADHCAATARDAVDWIEGVIDGSAPA